MRAWRRLEAAPLVLLMARVAEAQNAGGSSFQNAMAFAATALTIAVLSEAAAAVAEAAVVAHAPAILSLAAASLAAGGATNTVVGLALIGMVGISAVGVTVVAAGIVIGAIAITNPELAQAIVSIGRTGATTESGEQTNFNPPTAPTIGAFGHLDDNGQLTNLHTFTGRGNDPVTPNDVNPTITNSLGLGGIAPGDTPSAPGPGLTCCTTGLSLDLSPVGEPTAPSTPSDTPDGLGEVGLFMAPFDPTFDSKTVLFDLEPDPKAGFGPVDLKFDPLELHPAYGPEVASVARVSSPPVWLLIGVGLGLWGFRRRLA